MSSSFCGSLGQGISAASGRQTAGGCLPSVEQAELLSELQQFGVKRCIFGVFIVRLRDLGRSTSALEPGLLLSRSFHYETKGKLFS
jgi:hypothetical protein